MEGRAHRCLVRIGISRRSSCVLVTAVVQLRPDDFSPDTVTTYLVLVFRLLLRVTHVSREIPPRLTRNVVRLFVRQKVVFLEELAVDPMGTLESVFTFLGMDFVDGTGEKVNVVRVSRGT